MTLLIVEDDSNKRLELISFLQEAFPDTLIDTAASFHSGMKKIRARTYDLILLDMAMPMFDVTTDEEGGRPQSYGGRSILRQMDRHGITTPVLVVTQFDRFGEAEDALTLTELETQLAAAHPRIYCGSVYYNATMESWEPQLRRKIQETLKQ